MERTKIGTTAHAAQTYGALYGRKVLLELPDPELHGGPLPPVAQSGREPQLETDLAAMRQLNALVARLLTRPNNQPALQQILAGALEIARATKGTVHVWDEACQTLALAAHSGFDSTALKQLTTAPQLEESPQMQAAITRQRVVVGDTEVDSRGAAGAASAGCRAIQSTPLLGCLGSVIGVLSTYYSEPLHPSDSVFRLLDFYARQAATLVDPSTAIESLPTAPTDAGHEPTEEPRDPGPMAPKDHGLGLRVLVVDDNRPAADTLAVILESVGNELRTAYDGRRAIEVADAFQPDVILMDIGMPEMDGYETARCIRERTRGREPVLIALSGHGEISDKERTRAAGFYQHVVKPAKAADLCRILARVRARRN